ncbi:hypothetical protein N2152v2_005478 [Parachlorella kessleri]
MSHLQPQPQQSGGVPFRFLATHPTAWEPPAAGPTLNVRLDGCIVPSEAAPEGGRVSYSQLLVLNDFIDDSMRQQLLDFLTAPGPEDELGQDVAVAAEEVAVAARAGTAVAASSLGTEQQAAAAAGHANGHSSKPHAEVGRGVPGSGAGDSGDPQPGRGFTLPASKWEQCTTDMAGAAPSWGVKPHVLAQLAAMELPAMREVHARLCKLLPGYDIALLPSEAIQGQGQPRSGQQGGGGACKVPASPAPGSTAGVTGLQPGHAGGQQHQQQGQQTISQQDVQQQQERSPAQPSRPAVDCAAFVANAAVAGDSFAWHVDADPTSFPSPSPWVDAYGDYFNGEPGKPLLASLMLYLNPEWRREWGAETLFLDAATDSGVFVAPRPRRAVLFHQDILHRVSPPSAAADGRPRFSLVWKLALLPRGGSGVSGAQPLVAEAAAVVAGAVDTGSGKGSSGQQLGGTEETAAVAVPSGIAPPEWAGPPASFGSAARVDAVLRQLKSQVVTARKRQRQDDDNMQ